MKACQNVNVYSARVQSIIVEINIVPSIKMEQTNQTLTLLVISCIECLRPSADYQRINGRYYGFVPRDPTLSHEDFMEICPEGYGWPIVLEEEDGFKFTSTYNWAEPFYV